MMTIRMKMPSKSVSAVRIKCLHTVGVVLLSNATLA